MPDHPTVASLMDLSDEDMLTVWHALVVMRDNKTQPLDMVRRADSLVMRINRAVEARMNRRREQQDG
jgi:hypothetical protein